MKIFSKIARETGRRYQEDQDGNRRLVADYQVEYYMGSLRMFKETHKGILPGEAKDKLKVDQVIRPKK